jgi:hypothetical protein
MKFCEAMLKAREGWYVTRPPLEGDSVFIHPCWFEPLLSGGSSLTGFAPSVGDLFADDWLLSDRVNMGDYTVGEGGASGLRIGCKVWEKDGVSTYWHQ